MSILYRLATPADAALLSDFHGQACQAVLPPAFWQWKYFDNPAGPGFLVLALEDGRPVGRNGVYAQRFLVNGQELAAGQVADIDLLEPSRRGGVYLGLARFLRAAMAEHRLPFLCAVAVEATRELSTRVLGWRLVGPVDRWIRPLDPLAFLGRRLGLAAGTLSLASLVRRLPSRLPAGVRRLDLAELAGVGDALWPQLRRRPVMAVKDGQHLDWRYRRCPVVSYQALVAEQNGRPAGLAIFHLVEKERLVYGIVSELLVAEDDLAIARRLLAGAQQELARQGAASLVAWLPGHDPLAAGLRRQGWRPRPTPHYWLVYGGGPPVAPDDLTAPAAWTYSLGDSDYWMIPRQR
ncbi:MAG: GNAT family N-acetyltransferase [Thermodesulfobacteriota bacterium]